jgi:hypothetical protein
VLVIPGALVILLAVLLGGWLVIPLWPVPKLSPEIGLQMKTAIATVIGIG